MTAPTVVTVSSLADSLAPGPYPLGELSAAPAERTTSTGR